MKKIIKRMADCWIMYLDSCFFILLGLDGTGKSRTDLYSDRK